MKKKWNADENYTMRKLRNGEYRSVHKQIIAWRKRRKALGALKHSGSPRKVRSTDTKRNYFTLDEDT